MDRLIIHGLIYTRKVYISERVVKTMHTKKLKLSIWCSLKEGCSYVYIRCADNDKFNTKF